MTSATKTVRIKIAEPDEIGENAADAAAFILECLDLDPDSTSICPCGCGETLTKEELLSEFLGYLLGEAFKAGAIAGGRATLIANGFTPADEGESSEIEIAEDDKEEHIADGGRMQ